MKRLLRQGILLLLAFLCFIAVAWAEVAVPPLSARVTDLTATLSAAQRASLESELQGFEARNGSQIAVLLVPTTQPETIEQYSIRVVEAWKLGRKGNDKDADRGLLLLVAKNDRTVRIEVGYGLEGVVPDVLAKRVIDETITPRFKQGDFGGGIAAGVQHLERLIEGRSAPPPASASPPAAPVEGALDVPPPTRHVNDLAGVLSAAQAETLEQELLEFEARRGDHLYVLAVPNTGPESVDQYAIRAVDTWSSRDSLDVDTSMLLLVVRDARAVHIVTGYALQQLVPPETAERLVSEVIEPQVKKGEFAAGILTGVQQMERVLDGEALPTPKLTLSERMINHISEVPAWLLIVLAVIGTALRGLLGPLIGGLAMGGAVGAGAWLISGSIVAGALAGIGAFAFVLVGLSNWIAIGLSGSSRGGGSGGGFSGGGGGFGGGGASGRW